MKILVADDHNLVRETIGAFIQTQEGTEVLQASDLDGTLDQITNHAPIDLVLLDYRMPGMEGLHGLEQVMEASDGRPVALLSGEISPATVEEALRVGAAGFVPKSLAAKSLLQAINLMAAGEKFVPYSLIRQKEDQSGAHFTDRELSVLRGLCAGKPNKIIAAEMQLQEVTVKVHVKSICSKLEARNRTHAAMIARDRGLC
jgi:DNA-binding NarL/FixJ family response regulator